MVAKVRKKSIFSKRLTNFVTFFSCFFLLHSETCCTFVASYKTKTFTTMILLLSDEERLVQFLKGMADSTNSGRASYTLTYPDGSTLEIIYKPKK